MGRRTSYESFVGILAAFTTQRTWSQADLAREVGVSVDTVRGLLQDLMDRGVYKLERQEDHPHVYWSVPQNWHGAGVLLSHSNAVRAMRELARAPETQARNAVLDELEAALTGGRDFREVVSAQPLSDETARWLSVIEDAARSLTCVRMTYRSLRQIEPERGRVVSPQRVFPAEGRFLAWAHKEPGSLRWFRVDSVFHAELAPDVPWHPVPKEKLDQTAAQSADGYHDGREPEESVFLLKHPDASWAIKHLPTGIGGATVTETDGGFRVRVSTSGTKVVARFLVGLGASAVVETPALRDQVAALARASLSQNQD